MFAQDIKQGQPVKGKGLHKVHKDTPATVPASVLPITPSPTPQVKVTADKDDDIIYRVNPEDVTPWKFADRPDDEFGDMTELTESIKTYGQEVPALLRPLSGQKGKYELIYGRRRWTACLDLGQPLKAFIRAMDDQEAFKRMYIENEKRNNLSSWAKAQSWKNAIEGGIYKNDSALAAHLGIHRATLSNIMAYNRIAPEIVKAMGTDIKSVSIQSAKALAQLNTKEEIETAVALAEKIKVGTLNSDKITKAVKSALTVGEPGAESDTRSRVVTDPKGIKLFSVRVTGRGAVELSFTSEATKRYTQDELIDKIKGVFN
ncbi:ParB/RepB/Spo0J family partition protein [Ectopseudomonas mendocina]|nr:ParB/RepB/Spo0J family partition protein [Pseudomonas mendocina]